MPQAEVNGLDGGLVGDAVDEFVGLVKEGESDVLAGDELETRKGEAGFSRARTRTKRMRVRRHAVPLRRNNHRLLQFNHASTKC